MEISQHLLKANVSLINLKGRLDATTCNGVKEILQDLTDKQSTQIIIDLHQVSFIDSSGLAALVSGLRLAREREGNLILCGLQPQAQVVFRLTMLDRIFSIHPTVEDAKQGLV